MENDELYTALRNADAAGDTEGAAKLASYIQSRGSADAMPSTPMPVTQKPPINTELTWAEKNIAPLLPDWLGNLAGGNVRGSAVGRLAMGAADPGVALFQLGANAIGKGDSVNQSIADTEAKYQAARERAGSEGFDPLRMAGNVAITAPLGGLGGTAATLTGRVVQGGLQGAAFGTLQPVNQGDDYWTEKAKQAGAGLVLGGVAAPIVGAAARVISPNVSNNVQTLQREGITMSPGQAAGGLLNRLEEKMQSVPFIGDAIRIGRERGPQQLENVAFQRGGAPIGQRISEVGNDGILELKNKLSQSYDSVIPKLSADVTDPSFVSKIASLRQGVQNLPAEEARQFDNIIAREIDQRLAPNGMLSGQNLKDAWNALRDQSAQFLKSTDAYQQQLGAALKQTFNELKTHVSATNNATDVRTLANTDLGYANYKILQKAASGVNSIDGRFTPAQLQSAVKASDKSLDKGRFAEGRALMQDLSNAGKGVLTNKVPNSGTADRAFSGSIAGLGLGGLLSPLGLAYTPPVQNALVALMTRRPDLAQPISNYLRQMNPAITAGVTAGLLQNE